MHRHLAFNLLRQATKGAGIKVRRLDAAWDTEYLLQDLTHV